MSEISHRSWSKSRVAVVLRRVIIASVTVGALLAIVALLGGDFGTTQGKIIGTSFSLAGGGVLVLACASAWERGRLGPLPAIGSIASTVGVVMLVVAIWAEPYSEPYVKTLGTAFIVGGAVALLSLFELARVSPRLRWLVDGARALLGIVAAFSIGLIWWNDPAEWAIRLFGVVAVLLAASTVSVLAMHLAGGQPRQPSRRPAGDRVRFCPMCGMPADAAPGSPVTCQECGSQFTVETRVPVA